eukprot:2909487-Amphidinium_carterae.1
MEKDKTKSINNNPTINNKGKAIHNNSLPINSSTTINHHNLHNTTKATAKAMENTMENNGAVVTTKVETRDKFQFNSSTTMTTTTTTMKRTHPLGTLPTIRNGSQRQTTQLPGQKVDQQQVLQQQQSGPLTMGSLHEIDAIIHIGRQAPRRLKDFWSIIIDTGAAVSVGPMTFCEHIAVETMPESARRQYVTVTGGGLTIEGWKEVT